MGKTYPTDAPCGFKGRICATKDYPDCGDRRISPIPEAQPSDARELASWLNRWVRITEGFGGICKSRAGIWAIYHQSPAGDISPAQPPAAPAAAAPERADPPAPEPAPDDGLAMVFEEPPADPSEIPGFAFSEDPIGPAEEFDAFSTLKALADSHGLYAAIGAAVVVVVAGAYALMRRIQKRAPRVRAPAERIPPAAEAEPPRRPDARPPADSVMPTIPLPRADGRPPADSVSPTLPVPSAEAASIRYDAEVMQRMLSVHQRLRVMPWYGDLPLEEKFAAMRGGIERPGEISANSAGIRVEHGREGGKEVLTIHHRDGDSVRIRAADLKDMKRTNTITMEMDAALAQIRGLQSVGNLSEVEARSYARALTMWRHMSIIDGTWHEIAGGKAEGGGELRGPLPPDIINTEAARSGLGVNGKGDPLAAVAAPGLDPGKTTQHSTFWAQMISSDFFAKLHKDAREAVIARQERIELALHHAYDDPSFKRRYVDAKRISEDGLRVVLENVLLSDGMDPAANRMFRPLMQRPAAPKGKGDGSFPKRLRGFLRGK